MSDAAVQMRCLHCGAELGPSLLACPSCRALVHADALKALAAEAAAKQASGDLSGALAAWRRALTLLPSETRQFADVSLRVADLSRAVDASQPHDQASSRDGTSSKATGALGLGGLAAAALGKGKLLLLGLTKLSTLGSMLAFVGVYWALWGWKIGLGIALCIYVHEMGHVLMLRRYGIEATAPMFVPGLGAFIRERQHVDDAVASARVSLAGPRWGLGATLLVFAIGKLTGSGFWLALAQTSAWINLFNLIPFPPLDGDRALAALDRSQQLILVLFLAAGWWLTGVGMLGIVALVAAFRLFRARPSQPPAWPIFVEWILVSLPLAAVAMQPVPGAH